MIRLYFYVEGQTEQGFVQRLLSPHLARYGVAVMGPVLAASGRHRGRVFRGGGRSYQRVRGDLLNLMKQDDSPDVRFTTMFDLYALYADFPGRDEAETLRGHPRQRVRALEQALAKDVPDPRLLPHIQLHEYETVLLCGPEHFALVYEHADAGIHAIRTAVAEAGGPEDVNDGESTAPSKRIIQHFPRYEGSKTTDGVELAECVGLHAIRGQCPHFDEWLGALERLGADAPVA